MHLGSGERDQQTVDIPAHSPRHGKSGTDSASVEVTGHQQKINIYGDPCGQRRLFHFTNGVSINFILQSFSSNSTSSNASSSAKHKSASSESRNENVGHFRRRVAFLGANKFNSQSFPPTGTTSSNALREPQNNPGASRPRNKTVRHPYASRPLLIC
jgi:hypothetical protein